MITKKQYIILNYFLTRSFFLGFGISKLFNYSKNDVWISSILGTLLGLVILYIIYKLKSNKNKIYNIIILILSILSLQNIILSLTTMASTFFLNKTPTILIALSIIIVIIYAVKSGINTIAKVAEILIPLSICIILIKIISGTLSSDYSNFLPILYNNNLGVIKATLSYTAISIAPTLLLLNIDIKLNYKDFSLGYIIGSLSIILSIISILGILGSTLSSILRYPEYIALKKINILNFIENIENILTFIWLFDLIILGFISTYNIKLIISKFIKNNKLLRTIYLLILSIVIYLVIYVFNKNYNYTISLYKYEDIIIGLLIIILILNLLLTLIINTIKKSHN